MPRPSSAYTWFTPAPVATPCPLSGLPSAPEPWHAFTDAQGLAQLRLGAGAHLITIGRIGFKPESLTVTLAGGVDATLRVWLEERSTELEAVIVTATRSERRVEDEPVRVEVLGPEEVVEKRLMTPGDITMLLNETSGLRVQTTSPFPGRRSVEIIKGVASALHGGSALGGVINLTSRRPGDRPGPRGQPLGHCGRCSHPTTRCTTACPALAGQRSVTDCPCTVSSRPRSDLAVVVIA